MKALGVMDRRFLVGGIILAVMLALWAAGERGFPLGRLLRMGLHTIL